MTKCNIARKVKLCVRVLKYLVVAVGGVVVRGGGSGVGGEGGVKGKTKLEQGKKEKTFGNHNLWLV